MLKVIEMGPILLAIKDGHLDTPPQCNQNKSERFFLPSMISSYFEMKSFNWLVGLVS